MLAHTNIQILKKYKKCLQRYTHTCITIKKPIKSTPKYTNEMTKQNEGKHNEYKKSSNHNIYHNKNKI